jgi:hypothetical protein
MSSEEKENYISLVTTLLISVPYIIYVYSNYQSQTLNTEEQIKFWAASILILIPIRIVAEIFMHIVAKIVTVIVTRKEESEVVDERDELIELKAHRNSLYTFCIGFIISLLTVVLGQPVSWMFITMFASGFLAELAEIGSKIYYYKKGV